MVELTGLSKNQLREWCTVRKLVPPDIMPNGPGTHAMFTWQAALALRILKSIQDDWSGTVSTWAPIVGEFRTVINGTSFPSLFGGVLVFKGLTSMNVEHAPKLESKSGVLAIPLDPHLEVLASRLAIPVPNQLPLFPPMAVHS